MTLFECLAQHARTRPHALAYTFLNEDGSTTQRRFLDLSIRVKAIAAALQSRTQPGDRVILMYRPGLDFVEAILACFACGVVAVPIQTIQNGRFASRLGSVVDDARCRLVLTDRSSAGKIRRIAPDLIDSLPDLSWLETDSVSNDEATHYLDYHPAADDLAFLQYTSGSTGAPKGVMVGHDNVMNNQAMIQQAFQHDDATRFVGWLPLYHDMGLIGNTFQPLYLGIPAVLFAPMTFLMSPITWLRAISEHRATTSGAPSFAYELCAKRITDEEMAGLDLSSWTVAFNGAEPVRADVVDAFSERFRACGFRKETFYPCYGMAEATLFISGGTPGHPIRELSVDRESLKANHAVEKIGDAYRLVGCGRVYGDHDLAIVDPEQGHRLPDGRIGEIWVSGPSIAQGYWGRPELTTATFQAHTQAGQGPFMRTGDLGFVRDGELYVTGRIKDIIIVRGQNHYPTDLEATISDSHEAVIREGCVAVFTVEDEGVTRLVAVAEIQRNQVRRFSEDLVKQATARARKAVSDLHGLRLHELVLIRPATLPKTSSGKIQRSLCRTLYEKAALQRMKVRATPAMETTMIQ